MITCANCNTRNPSGAIFCTECGAQLVEADISTRSIKTDRELASAIQTAPVAPKSGVVDNAWGSLHLMHNGQILPLADRNEYTLGRFAKDQPVLPDLDLSVHDAYAAGVSRLHAVLKRDGKRITIMDLGSANGTYVNGKRLTANSERLLNHGDVVALGKFKFQVLLHQL
jgi:hypothetical protein